MRTIRSFALVSSMLLGLFGAPRALADCPPCDITVNYCELSNPVYNHIIVHACPESFVCFKFFRRACGTNTWTLIYEGPDNEICDPDYGPGDCMQYKCEKWSQITSGDTCTGSIFCQTYESMCPGGC